MAEDSEKSTTSSESGRSGFYGRVRIYTRFRSIDESNVCQMVNETYSQHAFNVSQIQYLWRYWKGEQPILNRKKEVRPEICNKIVENRAEEIMTFKTGYQTQEPNQYIFKRNGLTSDDKSKQMALLNDYMFIEGKESQDTELIEWMNLCGVGYRMVEPDREETKHDVPSVVLQDTAPFSMCIPNPKSCYVVYSKMYHHMPLANVWVGIDEDDEILYTVYTPSKNFYIKNGIIKQQALNALGLLPIIEYDLNTTRMGVFERVLPILDAINTLDSNRLDGVEQVVQALYLFKNCQIDEDEFLNMLYLGAVSVTNNDAGQSDVSLITNDLDQSQTQIVKDDLISALHDICGMPTKNTGGANDTGSAVYMRDGYSMAETHAKRTEASFKKSEREFLRLVLRICEIERQPIDLLLREIDIAFNRRNFDNMLTKAQTLSTLAQSGYVHPLDCFKACGSFPDPEAAYTRGMEWKDEQTKRQQEIFAQSTSQLKSQEKEQFEEKEYSEDKAGATLSA